MNSATAGIDDKRRAPVLDLPELGILPRVAIDNNQAGDATSDDANASCLRLAGKPGCHLVSAWAS